MIDTKIIAALAARVVDGLREKFEALEVLEARGLATPESHEGIAALRDLLERMGKLPDHPGKTRH